MMRRILSHVLPLMTVLAIPGVALAAGKIAEACCCCPLCCPQNWL